MQDHRFLHTFIGNGKLICTLIVTHKLFNFRSVWGSSIYLCNYLFILLFVYLSIYSLVQLFTILFTY